MKKLLQVPIVLAALGVLTLLSTSFNTDPEKWYCEDLKGSYQIEIVNSRKQVAVPSDICSIIDQNRKKSETVVYQLDTNISIRIFSEDELASGVKADNQFVYIQ